MVMRVGAIRVEIEINGSLSLKDKRAVLRSVKDRLKRAFNVSISEVDEQDSWQRAVLGIVSVSGDKKHLDGLINRVRDFLYREANINVLKYQMEIM